MLVSVLCAAAAWGQTPGPFTSAQATDGRTAYMAACASCHLANLTGRNEAPPLTGANFMSAWGDRTTNDLLTYLQSRMPPGAAGGQGEETYLTFVAFLLEANGARPG